MPGKVKVHCDNCDHLFWIETLEADNIPLIDCPQCSSEDTEVLGIFYLERT